MKKTFLEVLASPEQLKLNYEQRRVIRKILDANSPKIAAALIASAEDNRNLVANTKILARHGIVQTYPEDLGPDEEPETVELTSTGQTIASEYNIQTDPSLITKKEQEEIQKASQESQPEMGGGITQSQSATPQQVGLELSSFFKDINDLAKLMG